MRRFLFPIVFTFLALVVVPSASSDEFIYVAEEPRLCVLECNAYPGQTFSVYVESGYFTDVTGVTFRIESERFGPEHVQSISTPPGVSIVGGSPFTGISLSFGARALAHDPVLTLTVQGHSAYGDVWTRDNHLIREVGTTNVGEFRTFGWPFDCFGSSPAWDIPDTVVVAVGADANFDFRAVLSTGGYPPNAEVVVFDSEGWIETPFRQDVFASCGWCTWDWTRVVVPVRAPKGVPNDTLDNATLQMYSFGGLIDEQTVVLRAIAPIPVNPTTMGGIKAIYE
jgi:hypothetical protein